MLGASHVSQETLRLWLPQWDETFAALPDTQRPVHLQPARHAYYLLAFRSLVEGAQPQAVLWPLLRTWTRMVSLLPEGTPGWGAWLSACRESTWSAMPFRSVWQRWMLISIWLMKSIDDWARANGV